MAPLFKKSSITHEDFEKFVPRFYESMGILLLEKNRMYGSASMDMGTVGIFVHLTDKMKRLETLLNLHAEGKGETASFEGIEDTLKDIIGYATLGSAILSEAEIIAARSQE